jgi:hypothetical protein
MEDIPLYNSQLIKIYVEYLRKFYPQIDIAEMLEYAQIESYEVEESGHWLSQKQVDRFHERLQLLIDNPNISREVGRFSLSSETFSPFKKLVFGFLSPAMSYLLFQKIAFKVTAAATFKGEKKGGRRVEISTYFKEGVKENPHQCQNRIGVLEVLAKAHTKKLADVEHTQCVHKGGEFCRYIISWNKTSSYIWKLIRNYSFPLTFC